MAVVDIVILIFIALGAIGGFLIGGLGSIIDGWTMTIKERIALAEKEAKKA